MFVGGGLYDVETNSLFVKPLATVSRFPNMNQIEIIDGLYVTVDEDSQITVEVRELPKFSIIDVEISEIERTLDDAQVYYVQEGEEASEEKSVVGKLTNGHNYFTIPAGEYSYLRIDPSKESGIRFGIEAVRVYDSTPHKPTTYLIAAGLLLCWCGLCVYAYKINLRLMWVRLGAFRTYSYLLSNLVRKDFTTKYRRSVLGVLWSVLNPLLMAGVISIVFSNIMRIQIEHFAVFYLSGSLIFNFMSESTNGCLTAILGSAGLIKKVYIPKYIFPMEKCFFALVNTVFSFVALLILMPILGVSIPVTVLLFWLPLLYTLVFSIGLGMLLATANVLFRDVGHLYGVWVAAWMYLTPIIYPLDILPIKLQAGVEMFNPMVRYVDYFRQVVMYGTIPSLRVNIVCGLWAIGTLLVGTFVFKRQQDKFVLYM